MVSKESWEKNIRKQGRWFHRKNTDPAFLDAVEKFTNSYKDKKKVLVCEPTIGYIDYRAHESCVDLMCELIKYEQRSDYKFFKTCLGRLLVAYSREKFAELAVDYGFDYVFYIDDDHIWEKDIFERLQKHIGKYDIIAPLCTQRAEPYNPVMYKVIRKKEDGIEVLDNETIHDFKIGDMVEPDSVGFGACIVDVKLFQKIPKPWFFSMSAVGEDILFSMKATQEAKAKIVVDTNVQVGHLSEGKPVGYGDYLREKEKRDASNSCGNANMAESKTKR